MQKKTTLEKIRKIAEDICKYGRSFTNDYETWSYTQGRKAAKWPSERKAIENLYIECQGVYLDTMEDVEYCVYIQKYPHYRGDPTILGASIIRNASESYKEN